MMQADSRVTGRIYYYKLTHDTGAAPCVKDGLLSLAICKPMIRLTAKAGDLIFGFAANSLHSDNRLIYIASVTGVARDYYTNPIFTGRDDRVYELLAGRYRWRKEARHHGTQHMEYDIGSFPGYRRAVAVVRADFRYFGAQGNAEYKERFPLVRRVVEDLKRGYRVNHSDALRAQLVTLKAEVWGMAMPPLSAVTPSKGCRVSTCLISKKE